jgi:hypothetical protein
MTIQAGPYIHRRVRDHLRWARQFRIDADAAETKALELRDAAAKAEEAAMAMAAGTDAEALTNGERA